MAINFPSSPFVGQLFTGPANVLYAWNGKGWYPYGSSGSGGTDPAVTETLNSNTARIVELENEVSTLEARIIALESGVIDHTQGYIMPGYVEPGYFADVVG